MVDSSPDSYGLEVRTDGTPFWLVLGESANAGWDATVSEGSVGARQLVNGFANGWLVTPRGAGTLTMELRWTPQRFVWLGLAVSVVAVLACVALVVVAWRRRRSAGAWDAAGSLADDPTLWSPFDYPGVRPSTAALVALAISAAIGTSLFSRPWIGAVVGLATVVAARVARGRIVLSAGAPLASRSPGLPASMTSRGSRSPFSRPISLRGGCGNDINRQRRQNRYPLQSDLVALDPCPERTPGGEHLDARPHDSVREPLQDSIDMYRAFSCRT